MDMNFMVDEVVSVEKITSDSLRYDITVKDNHNFFANGILVHNCQNLSNELKNWRDIEFEVTEKLDGASCTMYLDLDDEFHVCSRNLDLKPSETNSFWRVAKKYDVETKMREAGMTGYAIQGELIGPGIQGNPYGLKEIDFYVFDIYMVYKSDVGKYIKPDIRRDFCKNTGLNHVPVISGNFGSYEITPITVNDFLLFAEDKSALNSKAEREGLVFKCTTNPDIHFKAISNKFLLKGGD